MRKNLRQSILKSMGRYLAITLIIALGTALFVGLLTTKTDMVATGQVFMDQQNMFDLRMIGNYGWTEKYVEKFAELPGVTDAEGIYYMDLIANTQDSSEELVYRFYTIPDSVNKVALRGGRTNAWQTVSTPMTAFWEKPSPFPSPMTRMIWTRCFKKPLRWWVMFLHRCTWT